VCERAEAGLFAEPEDPRAIADAIVALADDRDRCRRLGRNGRRWVLEHATRESLARKYLTVLGELTAATKARPVPAEINS